MDFDGIIKKLKAINFALGNVEVKGRENMDILLGSMQQLDRSVNELMRMQHEFEKNLSVEITPVEDPESAE